MRYYVRRVVGALLVAAAFGVVAYLERQWGWL
jgi:hypothetical protein